MSRLSTIYRAGGTNSTSTRRHLQLTPTQDAFPLLDSKEITECLTSCDFTSSEDLVSRPTSQFIRVLFEQFLDTFMGLSPESLQKQLKENDDDIDSTMNLIILHRASYKFLQGCGVYDLTLMDIKRPEPFRIRRILSAVVNFARFREEHSAECEKLVLESEASLEKVRKVQADNLRITEQLTDLKKRLEIDSNNPKTSTLRQLNLYNAKVESDLKKLKRTLEVVTSNRTQYREEKSRLVEKLDDIQYLISESHNSLVRNKAYSETNLPLLKTIIEDLNVQLIELQKSIEVSNSKKSSITVTIESIQTVENELKNLFRIIEEISNDLYKEREAAANLNRAQEQLDQLNIREKALSRQIDQLKRQLESQQEKRVKLDALIVEKSSKNLLDLALLTSDYTKLVAERDLKEEQFEAKKNEIRALDLSINKMKSEYQRDERNVELKMTRLNAQIRLYMEEIGKKVST